MPLAGDNQPAPRRVAFRRAPLLAFTILIWAFATLYYGGDIGLHSDDYALSLVDPVTGDAPTFINPIAKWGHFWRPLHLAIVYHLATWLHDAPSIHHSIAAFAYGSAALAAGLLAAKLSGWHAGIITALLIIAFPLNHEVALWLAAISTPLAVAILLLLARFSHAWSGSARSWRALWPVPVVGFIIPCLNEQPTAGILALPALCYFAARARPTRSWPHLAFRSLAPTALASIGVITYAALYLLDAPAEARRGSGALISIPEFPARLAAVYGDALQWFVGKPMTGALSGSWITGIHALTSTRAVIWAAAAAAILITTLLLARRAPGVHPATSPAPAPLACLAFGLALTLLALLPLSVIRGEGITQRSLLLPITGLALTLASVAELLRRRFRTRALGAALLGFAMLASAAGSVCFVGYQTLYRESWRADQRVAAQMLDLVERPMITSVFVILENRLRPIDTGHLIFDGAVPGAWNAPWSANRLTQRTYGRAAVSTLFCPRGRKPAIRRVTTTHALAYHPVISALPTDDGLFALPWERTIPIILEPDGSIRIVTELWLERDDFTDERIPLPFIGAHAAKTGLPRISRGLAEHPTSPADGGDLALWQRPTGQPVEFLPATSWGRAFDVAVLSSEPGLGALELPLPPSENPRRVSVRVAIWEQRLAADLQGDGCVVRMQVLDPQGRNLANARVPFPGAGQPMPERWRVLSIDVPASPQGVTVRVSINKEVSGTPEHDFVLITRGRTQPIEESR